MKEYEIYLPTTLNDGSSVEPAIIEKAKETLVKTFGGYTHLTHRNEGGWRIGGVTFRDEITLLRVIDSGTPLFDMEAFKKSLERELQQDSVLIVAREVSII